MGVHNMKASLKASLDDVLYEWIGAHCEEGDWPYVFVDENTHERMADVAATILDAITENQNYLRADHGIEL